jgi:membrane fusion protein (multidrug efflux system)
MPAPEVGVLTVQPGDVGLQTELPGRLEASRGAGRARATASCSSGSFRKAAT